MKINNLKGLLAYYRDCLRHEANPGMRLALDPASQDWTVVPLHLEWNQSGVEYLSADEVLPPAGLSNTEKKGQTWVYGYPLLIKKLPGNDDEDDYQMIPVMLQDVELQTVSGEARFQLKPVVRLNDDFIQAVNRDATLNKALSRCVDVQSMLSAMYQALAEQETLPLIEFIGPTIPLVEFEPSQGEGLYNRAILAPRPPSTFTVGLEGELDVLQENVTKIEGTALNGLLGGMFSPLPKGGTPPIEIFPVNAEQKTAVAGAFTQPLTVVSGPPGTGKTSVVLSVLINAFLRGERVLFAAKNHKAIDVIETRLNEMQDIALLLRAGQHSGERNLKAEIESVIDRHLSRAVKTGTRSTVEDRLNKYLHSLNRIFQLNRLLSKKASALAECQSAATWLASHPLPDATGHLKTRLQEWTSRLALLRQSHRHLVDIVHQSRWWNGLKVRWQIHRWLARYNAQLRAWSMPSSLIDRCPTNSPLKGLGLWETYFQGQVDLVHSCQAAALLMEVDVDALMVSISDRQAELNQLKAHLHVLGREYFDAYVSHWAASLTGSAREQLGSYLSTLKRLSSDMMGGSVRHSLQTSLDDSFAALANVFSLWASVNLSIHHSIPLSPGLFDLVIVDEATQSDIISALPLLYRAKRALLVGDQMQLCHVTTIPEGVDQQLQSLYGLSGVNQQRWTYSAHSLFDLARTNQHAYLVQLVGHFRCHPEIIGFCNQQWYQNVLRVETDIAQLHSALPAQGIRWLPVTGALCRGARSGVYAPAEVDKVVEVLLNLAEGGFSGSVGVVTPFREQVGKLLQAITEHVPAAWRHQVALTVGSAHGFQGDEKDIMLFSLCVGTHLPSGARRFLSETDNLFNVAVSRARGLLYVIADP